MDSLSRWGIDVGMARIGIARSPRGTSLVLPVQTLKVDPYGQHFEVLVELLTEGEADIIYLGLPLHLNGNQGQSVEMVMAFARELYECFNHAEIRFVDERLTSSTAHQRLSEAGVAGKNRKRMVDQVAASVILETAIEYEIKHDDRCGKFFAPARNERMGHGKH